MSHGAEQDHGVHWNQRGINQKVIQNDQKQCKMAFTCNVWIRDVFFVGVKFAFQQSTFRSISFPGDPWLPTTVANWFEDMTHHAPRFPIWLTETSAKHAWHSHTVTVFVFRCSSYWWAKHLKPPQIGVDVQEGRRQSKTDMQTVEEGFCGGDSSLPQSALSPPSVRKHTHTEAHVVRWRTQNVVQKALDSNNL